MANAHKNRFAFQYVALAILGLAAFDLQHAEAGVTVSSSRSSVNVGGTQYDQLTFNITGYTGTDSTYAGPFQDAGVDTISNVSGTFTSTGGVMSLAGSVSNNYHTTNQFSPGTQTTPPGSYINFDSVSNSVTTVPTPPTAGATSINDTWFTSIAANRLRPVESADGTANGFNQTQLAVFYVTPGANVSFSGTDGTDANASESLSFSSVPEPAEIGILALSGCAVLARRRRVR